jgi:hypothetical protein
MSCLTLSDTVSCIHVPIASIYNTDESYSYLMYMYARQKWMARDVRCPYTHTKLSRFLEIKSKEEI